MLCRHFARGHCQLGSECGFLHPGSHDLPDFLVPGEAGFLHQGSQDLGKGGKGDGKGDFNQSMGNSTLPSGLESTENVAMQCRNGMDCYNLECPFEHPAEWYTDRCPR